MNQPIRYTGPTANPADDAARFDDEQDAADAFYEQAQVEAPKLVLKDLQAITKPSDWFKSTFHGGNCADEILSEGMSSSDDIADSYAEFMVSPSAEAKDKMLRAMADWFGKLHALEIYSDHLKDLSDD